MNIYVKKNYFLSKNLILFVALLMNFSQPFYQRLFFQLIFCTFTGKNGNSGREARKKSDREF